MHRVAARRPTLLQSYKDSKKKFKKWAFITLSAILSSVASHLFFTYFLGVEVYSIIAIIAICMPMPVATYTAFQAVKQKNKMREYKWELNKNRNITPAPHEKIYMSVERYAGYVLCMSFIFTSLCWPLFSLLQWKFLLWFTLAGVSSITTAIMVIGFVEIKLSGILNVSRIKKNLHRSFSSLQHRTKHDLDNVSEVELEPLITSKDKEQLRKRSHRRSKKKAKNNTGTKNPRGKKAKISPTQRPQTHPIAPEPAVELPPPQIAPDKPATRSIENCSSVNVAPQPSPQAEATCSRFRLNANAPEFVSSFSSSSKIPVNPEGHYSPEPAQPAPAQPHSAQHAALPAPMQDQPQAHYDAHNLAQQSAVAAPPYEPAGFYPGLLPQFAAQPVYAPLFSQPQPQLQHRYNIMLPSQQHPHYPPGPYSPTHLHAPPRPY